MQNPIFNIPNLLLAGLAVVLLALTPQRSAAQAAGDTLTYQFWYASPDVRGTGLGDATMADPRNLLGLYVNPALIALNNRRTGLAFSYDYLYESNAAAANLTVALALPYDQALMIGGSAHYPLESRLEGSASEDRLTQYTLSAAYALALREDLSLGLSGRLVQGVSNEHTEYVVNGSAGIYYKPEPVVSYGLVYRGTVHRDDHLGSKLLYRRIGDGDWELLTAKAPQRLEVGATLRFPALSDTPQFVLSLATEKLFGEDGLVYRGGLELFLSDFMAIRGGYFHGEQADGLRLGAGLILGSVHLDYAYSAESLDRLGAYHQLGMQIHF